MLLLWIACSSEPELVEVDVACDADTFFDETWTFTAETAGEVDEVAVEFWIEEVQRGRQPMNDLGRGSWWAEAFQTTVGLACDHDEEVEFLFQASGPLGEVEQSVAD